MICVLAKKDVAVNDIGYQWTWPAPEVWEAPKAKEIYVATHQYAVTMKSVSQAIKVDERVPFPPILTREFIENPPDKRVIRMLALNGTGSGIGDCIGGIPAYTRLREEFEKRGRTLIVDILCQDGKWPWSDQVYRYVRPIDRIIPGAWRLDKVCQDYDVMTDTEGYVTEMDELNMHMYDFMCKQFCVDPTGPHRPPWGVANLPWQETIKALEDVPKPRMVLNFFASAIRMIPKMRWRQLIRGYVQKGYEVILTASKGIREHLSWAMKVDPKTRKHVHDLTEVTSRSIHHLAALVSHVDLVCTPDTGLMHICGLAGVPTVAVFYSIDPELRVRDFPSVNAFCPQRFRDGPHWGQHKPDIVISGKGVDDKYIERMKYYSNPEKVPEWHHMWEKVKAEAILDAEPGPRCESTIYVCPMRGEGNACDWAYAPEEVPEGRCAQPSEDVTGPLESADPVG